MSRFVPAALFVIAIGTAPAGADEFTETVEGALDAYTSGEIGYAREELEYAIRLLDEIKSESLSGYLPEAQAGWTREDAEGDGSGIAMAMLGGGTTAAARYLRGDEEFTITLTANSPMVASIAAMIGGMSTLGGGKPLRIQRTRFSNTDGELQGVIDNKVLVSVSGDAPLEAITAHLETMDFEALADF